MTKASNMPYLGNLVYALNSITESFLDYLLQVKYRGTKCVYRIARQKEKYRKTLHFAAHKGQFKTNYSQENEQKLKKDGDLIELSIIDFPIRYTLILIKTKEQEKQHV